MPDVKPYIRPRATISQPARAILLDRDELFYHYQVWTQCEIADRLDVTVKLVRRMIKELNVDPTGALAHRHRVRALRKRDPVRTRSPSERAPRPRTRQTQPSDPTDERAQRKAAREREREQARQEKSRRHHQQIRESRHARARARREQAMERVKDPAWLAEASAKIDMFTLSERLGLPLLLIRDAVRALPAANGNGGNGHHSNGTSNGHVVDAFLDSARRDSQRRMVN